MADSKRIAELKEKVALLPESPGIYQFLGADGRVIYVGKAKNLKRRVYSYFTSKANESAKVRVMVSRIADLRHTVVATENEAFLLENSMIKSLQPRYNILLKDDKTYPWIVIRNEPFPRVQSTRRRERDGSRYFGPYASVYIQKTVLDLVRSIHSLRTCSLNLSPEAIAKGKYSVCLEYHIGNCKGPCVGLQSETEYREGIELVTSLLRGDTRETTEYLRAKMVGAAAEMRFEEAAVYKKRIEALAAYQSKSVVVSNTLTNLDVFSLVVDDDAAYCNFMRIADGAVVNSFTVELKPGLEDRPQDILTYAISRIAEQLPGGRLSREAIVPLLPAQELFEGVTFTVPQRGDKLHLLELSERNSRLYRLEKLKQIEIKDPERHTNRILAALQKELHLSVPPRHIECFDNSNLQGTNPVASCVVFRDAKPARKEYRHFNIKTVVGANDFASMKEVIGRRYRRLLDEDAELPQLIVVDGGKGQLRFAYETLLRLGIADRVAIVGLAKRIEEVYFPHDSTPYYLDRNSEALKVLMHIRDEAHRFGITFHRKKRSLAFIKSELESIPTLGNRSVEKLLQRFRTLSRIRTASETELSELIGRQRAAEVIRYFREAPADGTKEGK
ncbi:excinuclease ABC subunit UvrC [Alistipes sp. cv1]|uniref:excinuclease ABC subunit UvrC n=1 Tax=Alistipes sp. cv1 TaxID=1622071 RepID=UPI000C769CCC|nr:excinuclease ABC subunit UvrC [Alistipes sp. cv1]